MGTLLAILGLNRRKLTLQLGASPLPKPSVCQDLVGQSAMKLARAWLVVVLAVPGAGLLAGSGVEPRTAIELFSGIGGMRAALAAADPSWKVAEAFDVNELANRVYR